eukprot:scaffold301_cov243-Pinguiococcus_pyrenoidosus.AAC.1
MGTWQTIRAVDTLFVSWSKAVNQVLGCRVVIWLVWEIVGPQRPLEQRIIDTEEFQRLDELHQLGTAKFVYRGRRLTPSFLSLVAQHSVTRKSATSVLGAKHSRFEHSLGVAHLAEKLVLSLRRRQGLANITEEDVLCVKIAGLCHDLGHGPFSHLFDDVIVPEFFPGKIIPGMNGGEDWKWSHESASLKLFDALLENNGIQLSDYGLDDQDRQFIKELISPPKEPHLRTGRKLPNGKVDFDKAFLYDIVNNTQSGLDVDKLDYFSRDSQRVGVIVSDRHEYQRLFQNARVCYVKKGGREYTQICFRDKLVKDLLDVFRTRFDLHYKVYQHKTVKAIEFMIRDALVIAATDRKRTISVSGKPSPVCPDGRYGIAEAVHEMTAYAKLKDSILDFIAASSEPELEEARILIKRIRTRDLYRCCGELETFPEALFEEEDNEDRLLDEIIHSYHRAYPEAAARTSGAKRKRPGGEQGAKREDGTKRRKCRGRGTEAPASLRLTDSFCATQQMMRACGSTS